MKIMKIIIRLCNYLPTLISCSVKAAGHPTGIGAVVCAKMWRTLESARPSTDATSVRGVSRSKCISRARRFSSNDMRSRRLETRDIADSRR